MNPRDVPHFNGYETPVSDFNRARTLIATPFQKWDLDLTNAGDQILEGVSGDFLYIDTDPQQSNGVATIQLNVQQDVAVAPFYVQPGWAINAVFKRVRVTWSAQPGKRLRLMYSTGERVVPANTATINISNTVGVQEQGFAYGASYKSTTGLAAGTPDTIWTPAANVNGAVLWAAFAATRNQTPTFTAMSLLAKTAAPGTVIDGDLLTQMCAGPIDAGAVTNVTALYELKRAVRVAAGKGAYHFNIAADGAFNTILRSALYTLL